MELISMNLQAKSKPGILWGKSCRMTRVAGLVVLLSPAVLWAQAANPCDLTGDSIVDSADVTAAVSTALGQSTCTGNIVGAGTCNAVTVQRVVNASLGGTCIAGNPHSASLTWNANPSANVVGYNVYRSASSTGQYVKLTSSPVIGTSYTDNTVQAGQNYNYVLTSVDDFGNESAFSGLATASVPFP
jgi:hypothetical protein